MSAHRHLHDGFQAAYAMTDPGSGGTITVDRDRAVCKVVTAGAETRTLAQPTKAGLICTIELKTWVGDLTLTVTGGYNQAATTSIVFGTAGDWVVFHSVDVGGSYYWRVINHEGTSVVETGAGTYTSLAVTTLTGTTCNMTSATHTNVNATTGIIGTINGTNSTLTSLSTTNANATLGLITTVNGTSATITNINGTTGIIGTINGTNSTITTASITNATLGRVQVTASAVTAAGSAAGNAAATNYGMNIVTGANNATGIILPATVANGCVEVIQTVNNAYLLIYPASLSAIAGLGTNNALNTGVANTAATGGTAQNVYFKFVATNATQWYVSK